MKKIIIATTLTVGVLGLSACGSGKADPEVVVETKAGNVTKEEFYEEMKDQYGEQVLQQLVIVRILEDKYDVSDKEIDKEYENYKKEYGENFEALLEQQGLTEDDLREEIRLKLLQDAAMTDGIEVSDEEIKEYYERMKTEVKARHVLVEDEETAKKVKKKLDKGEDFAKLAKEYSMDPASAEAGGDIGFFSVGMMDPAFEKAAFTMKKGDISDPVQSDHGFHIIEVTDTKKVEEDVGTLEENKEDIRRNIAERKINPEEAMEKINKLLSDSDIKVKIEDLKDIFDTEQAQG